jgi:hypothetical protein
MTERLNIRRMHMPEKQKRENLQFDQDRELDPDDVQNMREKLQEQLELGQFNKYIVIAVDLRILNPLEKLTLSDDQWSGVKNVCERNPLLRSLWNIVQTEDSKRIGAWDRKDFEIYSGGELEKLRQSEDWFQFAELAAIQRLAHGTQVPISDSEWEQMHEVLTADLLELWSENAAHMAAAMKILAAEEVKIDDTGLRITMRKRDMAETIPKSPDILHL